MEELIGLDLGGMAEKFARAASLVNGLPNYPDSGDANRAAATALVNAAKAAADAASRVLGHVAQGKAAKEAD